MTLAVAARIARRELRGGLKGFRIFLACLTLGRPQGVRRTVDVKGA